MESLSRTGGRGRIAALALTGIFAASACTASASEPIAVAPATNEPGAALPVAEATLSPSPLAIALTGSTASPAIAVPSPEAVVPSAVPALEELADRKPDGRKPKAKVKTIKLDPRPKRGPFSMNLYRDGDFVHQQTKDWCVAGSTQTMMNIMDKGKPNTSRAYQRRLYVEGRRLSNNQAKLTAIGVDLTGWADLLSSNGYGRYEVDGRATRRGAIRAAAKAIRETGRPVGLVVWRGAHSWVMSGFTATADPAYTDDFEVRKVFIQDVWYPYVSTIWGASRRPNAAVPVAALAQDYLPYRRPSHRWPKRDGTFMLVLPALPKGTVVR